MQGWKQFFWGAAAYHWLVGIPLYLSPALMVDTVGGSVAASDMALMKIIGALLVCFGIVYAIVAHDPARFRPILWAGVIGKLGVALVFARDWLLGTIPWPTIALSLVDMSLVVIFLFFIFRRPLKSQLDAAASAA
ncbi:MAG: hypothetical protein KDA53_07820 [Hyphomonas sp.]|nr:hypothetical protein [Hyphomonas sp.]